jgi:putative peptidoglycan lipid II flippase
MINSAIGMGINVGLNFALAPLLGIGGLALATSISALITVILLTQGLRRKLGRLNLTKLVPSTLKIVMAAGVSTLIALMLYGAAEGVFGMNISLVIALSVMVLLYFSAVYLLKIEGADIFIKGIMRRFKRKRN